MANEQMFPAEYIWLGGTSDRGGMRQFRSKTRVISIDSTGDLRSAVPKWAFDGSSTGQAEGRVSDCRLEPVFVCSDPLRGNRGLLVFCEVLGIDGSPHPSNTRAFLRAAMQKHAAKGPWIGVEQEYTLFRGDQPLAWAELGKEPTKQGPHYCSVGDGLAFGRELMERHFFMCLAAHLAVTGTNAEVMPGQWEFQIGGPDVDPLTCADQLWVARWLLERLGEDFGITVSFAPKPKRGDWNGAGAHTNFSTKAMREDGGMTAIREACIKLQAQHKEHIKVYGEGNEHRLTGKHETCAITDFRFAEYDRGASVRIPIATVDAGKGYLEDRRPAANMDPYLVFTALLETICGDGFRG